MKKILLSTIALAGILSVNAQVQRLELYEEFTGENCGPCAGTNPGLTTLIDNNQIPNKKILLLRYQCNIPSAPGAGSLYADNPSEVGVRQTYYSVPFAPYARFSGIQLPDLSGSGNDGHAAILDQNIIDTTYNDVNAKVSISATHTYNAACDSVTINVTVTAAMGFTPSGALKLQVAMIEKEIHFATAPGSNGEKDFEWVMRKMVPNASGTTMTAGAWTNAQSQSFTLKAKIPTYIKDKNQLAIIGFVQDDGTKLVLNAAFSDAIALTIPDGTMMSASAPTTNCVSVVTPSIVIKNTGTPVLTSATINYKLDGGATQVYNFVGNLPYNTPANITLPGQTVAAGTHTVTATITMPNGVSDVNVAPDTKAVVFTAFLNPTSGPMTQAFTAVAFPPAGYTVVNNGGDNYKWVRATATGSASGSGAAVIDFYNGAPGQVDDFYLPYTTLGTGSQLTFYVASAPYSTAAQGGPENDQLDFVVSTDCGATWTNLYSKAGAALNTAVACTTSYSPTTAPEWRMETVNLSAFDGMNNLLFKFIGTSGYGNRCFVDDINLTSTVGLEEVNNITNVSVYPNPASNSVNIKVSLVKQTNASINIYNSIGETVYSENRNSLTTGDNNISVNTAAFANGIYSIIISTDNGVSSKKLIINR